MMNKNRGDFTVIKNNFGTQNCARIAQRRAEGIKNTPSPPCNSASTLRRFVFLLWAGLTDA
jgi:hypothetical protein